MRMMPDWTAADAARVLVMWIVMMAAMMLPGAASAIASAASYPPPHGRAGRAARSAQFVVGYLAVWTGFSVLATLLEWALDSRHLLSPSMAIGDRRVGAVILIAVGLYQLTPLKHACLERCRLSGLARRFDVDRRRARAFAYAGVRYGVYCLGTSAALMSVLFVVGVMNAACIALIALVVLAEKTLSRGVQLSRVIGLAIASWGAVSLAGPVV